MLVCSYADIIRTQRNEVRRFSNGHRLNEINSFIQYRIFFPWHVDSLLEGHRWKTSLVSQWAYLDAGPILNPLAFFSYQLS